MKDTAGKTGWKYEILPILIIILSVFVSIYFYNLLPDTVITHWGINGQADGYGSKSFNLIFPPVMLSAMYLLFIILPRLDPHKDKYQEFKHEYHIFKTAILFFFLIVMLVADLVNIGVPIQINIAIPVAIGVLFILLGNYLGKLKRNWFIGIRTPWTMSSDRVWQKTHRLGGWIFVLFGLSTILATIITIQLNWLVFIAGVMIAVIVPIIYSYILFRKNK